MVNKSLLRGFITGRMKIHLFLSGIVNLLTRSKTSKEIRKIFKKLLKERKKSRKTILLMLDCLKQGAYWKTLILQIQVYSKFTMKEVNNLLYNLLILKFCRSFTLQASRKITSKVYTLLVLTLKNTMLKSDIGSLKNLDPLLISISTIRLTWARFALSLNSINWFTRLVLLMHN